MVDSDDGDQGESVSQVGGFGESEMRLSFQGAGGFGSSRVGSERDSKEFERLVDRTINATVVLAVGKNIGVALGRCVPAAPSFFA
ncbi:hypothetical protein D8674_026588 [Pyrus ussuriensis x Pyrus communis]|uniref:Uncharacterized protein n=1 Tax=Pyrus ussuriensis x Pyrus communis TaxID=2448454 RepID=A0A5N5ILW4_9ROSA|nr:hypothetical protein D8674_026588 [Pyrus ussuriensis x Pyrus communis]